MTRYQEYLARDMTEDDIRHCEQEAQKLEQSLPWAEQDNSECQPEVDSWLTVVMRDVAKEIEYNRSMYCREMED